MGNSKDFSIAEPNIQPYFNIRPVQCFITWEQNEWETSSDNSSVLVNTMACLGALVYTPQWIPMQRMVGLNILK